MQRSYLFIHQNLPGQFGRMAQELARQSHKVQALADKGRGLPGIPIHRYSVQQSKPPSAETVLFLGLQAQLQRANAAAQAMQQLKQAGYQPDVIIAHPGWGEALFCKDICPQAKLVIFAEWFYNAHGSDANFDPEFVTNDAEQTAIGVRLKNTVHLHACHAADAIFTPTQWQKKPAARGVPKQNPGHPRFHRHSNRQTQPRRQRAPAQSQQNLPCGR